MRKNYSPSQAFYEPRKEINVSELTYNTDGNGFVAHGSISECSRGDYNSCCYTARKWFNETTIGPICELFQRVAGNAQIYTLYRNILRVEYFDTNVLIEVREMKYVPRALKKAPWEGLNAQQERYNTVKSKQYFLEYFREIFPAPEFEVDILGDLEFISIIKKKEV